MAGSQEGIAVTLLDSSFAGAREVRVASADVSYRLYVVPARQIRDSRTHKHMSKPHHHPRTPSTLLLNRPARSMNSPRNKSKRAGDSKSPSAGSSRQLLVGHRHTNSEDYIRTFEALEED